MSPAHQVVHLPLPLLPALLAALLAIGLLLALLAKRSAARNRSGRRDWSVPVIDTAAEGNSPFHRWDIRFKLVALLCFAFLVVATRSLPAGLIALTAGLAALLAARVPLHRALRRLLAMAGFLGMFVIIMPLTVPLRAGDTLVIFQGMEFLSFNLRGLLLAATICAKACAVALLMEPMLATAPLPATLEGLSRLGVPAKVGQMILLAHRYIFVFLEEARRMATGMNVRGFRRRTNPETLRVTGNYLGMLFVRSFERTHRVYDAMQARGYEGEFPHLRRFRARPADWLLAGVWVLAGVALLIADRLWLSGML
jgi:cobalt/nickel transport system permease protein